MRPEAQAPAVTPRALRAQALQNRGLPISSACKGAPFPVEAMANRQIKDKHGAVWDVWDVNPGASLGGAVYDRRSGTRSEDSRADDRDVMLHAELKYGWLCFQTGSQRRRLAPIPAGWFQLTEAILLTMLDVARPVGTSANLSATPPVLE